MSKHFKNNNNLFLANKLHFGVSTNYIVDAGIYVLPVNNSITECQSNNFLTYLSGTLKGKCPVL